MPGLFFEIVLGALALIVVQIRYIELCKLAVCLVADLRIIPYIQHMKTNLLEEMSGAGRELIHCKSSISVEPTTLQPAVVAGRSIRPILEHKSTNFIPSIH